MKTRWRVAKKRNRSGFLGYVAYIVRDAGVRSELFAWTLCALTAGAFVFDRCFPLGFAGGILYVVPVALSVFARRFWSVLATAGAATALIWVDYFWSSPGPSPHYIVLMNRGFSTGVLWILAMLFFAIRHRRGALEALPRSPN